MSSLSHVQAVDKTSNPECEDLKNVQAAMKKAVKLVPGASVDCKPNKNCTGTKHGKPEILAEKLICIIKTSQTIWLCTIYEF